MELRRYWLIVRRWLWLIVGTFVGGLLLSWIVAATTTPVYAARARLIVGPTVDSPSASFDTIRAAQQLVVTYRELVTTGLPLDATISRLALPVSRAALAGEVNVQSSDVTRILTINVRDHDARRAADIANTIATVLVERSSQSNQPESRLTVIEDADPNFTPVEPNKPVIVILGTTAALLAAAGLILLVEVLQGLVKTEHDLRSLTRAPVLATFTLGRRRHTADPFLASDRREHRVGESYHLASLKLLAGFKLDQTGRTVLVCSPTQTELVAGIRTYLAAACAQLGHPTLIVDGDIGERHLSRFFALEHAAGFSDLVREIDLDSPSALPAVTDGDQEARFRVPLHDTYAVPQLHVLPAGSQLDGRALSPLRLRSTVEALHNVPAVTIIVGPPIITSPDALLLAQSVDTIVLLAASDETKAVDVQNAIENLELVGAQRIWGVLVRKSSLARWSRLPVFQRDRRATVVQSDVELEAAVRTPAGATGSI